MPDLTSCSLCRCGSILFALVLLAVGLVSLTQAADSAPARTNYDDNRLRELGITRYESKRLRLLTDIPAEKARSLPPLVDQAYDAWAAYFGPLPRKDAAEFQITGYVMHDLDRFRAAKMIRDDLPAFDHGRHMGLEFWMKDQAIDDYREHLLLHEATHCFMTASPAGGELPLWYHEGMAELFGVHRRNAAGRVEFGVFPASAAAHEGFGRIRVIANEVASRRPRSAAAVAAFGEREFASVSGQPYAWSWALCSFLDKHPRYRDRFHELAKTINDRGFTKRYEAAFHKDTELESEWKLFCAAIEPGYDFERAAIDFRAGTPLTGPTDVRIRADHGWQSTGLTLKPGQGYVITAQGRVTLGSSTRPWISEPDGISLRYSGGQPIGKLLGAIVGDLRQIDGAGGLLKPLVAGSSTVIEPATAGTLYLRVNDAWSGLRDNAGDYVVTIALEAGRAP